VVGVDPDAGSVTVRMDDGRTHALGADQIGPEKLALGYATTVHRSQGATFDTAHLFADGGGRELGYVAMSRARHTAHVHAVADNVHQGVEDLTWDWSREKRQAWAIDTGTPETQGRHPLEIEAHKQTPAKLRGVFGRARLKAERAALTAAASDQTDPALRRQVAGLDRHIQLLDQRLDPSKHRMATKPFSTPAEPPAPGRCSGLTL
jgi:UvrD-like helicase C-terminal domain